MTTAPALWAIVVCLFGILLTPMLLFPATLPEHLIASPALIRAVPRRQKADVPLNGKER